MPKSKKSPKQKPQTGSASIVYEDGVVIITEDDLIRKSDNAAIPLSSIVRVYRRVKTKETTQTVSTYGTAADDGKWHDGWGEATVNEFAGFDFAVITDDDHSYYYDYGEDSADETSDAISALKKACPNAAFGAPSPSQKLGIEDIIQIIIMTPLYLIIFIVLAFVIWITFSMISWFF